MTTPTKTSLTGIDLLHDPALNKGSAFTQKERTSLGLEGLLPPRINSQQEQVDRALGNLREKATPLEKFIFMVSLQDRNETLFYRLLLDYLEEIMPIIYTPTVGKACQEYAHIFRRPRGLYITSENRGKIIQVLRNWPHQDARVIVVTVGKLSLYTACAGIHPSQCLPITIDVGTENEKLLADPLYLGLRQRRLRGPAYDELIDEFITATQKVFPHALIQFEDFANRNAFRLLNKYRDHICTFNDDIQGTAAVAFAGLFGALRITKRPLKEQKILFFGAGEAGTGIADLVVCGMKEEGMPEVEARQRCWFMDSEGLVVKGRKVLAEHKGHYAQDHSPTTDPLEVINFLQPTALIGVCGQAGAFSEPILRLMARINERPIIFALSNPTSMAECTAEEAYRMTDCRAVFASGSPFNPVTINGHSFVPGQGNNSYIFPGVGLGVVASKSKLVTNEMFLTAARTLAGEVMEEDLKLGRVYPPLTKIRQVSAAIALATAEIAYARKLAQGPKPANLSAYVKSLMYEPVYESYV